MVNDPRIVFGARCSWWDSIDKTARTGGDRGLPCCPHCRSVLYEFPNEQAWWAAADKYERQGNPGYRKLLEWSRGKCFPTFAATVAAYRKANL